MHCLFHIGFHKTGTTSFQSLIESNRDRLGENTAALVRTSPELAGLRDSCLQYSERPEAAAGERITAETETLLRMLQASGASRVLITGAGLSGAIPAPSNPASFYRHTAEVIRRVEAGAAGHQTSYAVYTRNLEGWLSSLFRHHLRTRGLRMTFDSFRELPAIREFTFRSVLDAIGEAAGDIKSFRMEDDFGERLGPGTGLLRIFGYDEDMLKSWVPAPRRNEGISARTVERLSYPGFLLLPAKLRKLAAERMERT